MHHIFITSYICEKHIEGVYFNVNTMSVKMTTESIDNYLSHDDTRALDIQQGPLLLTWFNFNHSIDK